MKAVIVRLGCRSLSSKKVVANFGKQKVKGAISIAAMLNLIPVEIWLGDSLE